MIFLWENLKVVPDLSIVQKEMMWQFVLLTVVLWHLILPVIAPGFGLRLGVLKKNGCSWCFSCSIQTQGTSIVVQCSCEIIHLSLIALFNIQVKLDSVLLLSFKIELVLYRWTSNGRCIFYWFWFFCLAILGYLNGNSETLTIKSDNSWDLMVRVSEFPFRYPNIARQKNQNQ